MKSFLTVWVLSALLVLTTAESCANPKVQATSYTPADAEVLTHIAYIAEFTLTCSNGATNVNLFADINGAVMPVIRSQDGSKYQVSWTESLKAAKKGDRPIRLYDEEGFAAVKRILERDEDPSSVKPLVQIEINYPGAYTGPWMKSEHLASLMIFLVFYLAYSSKNGLTA
ncbi:hypothetical protein TCAL_11625 [Tigriopus californicus]|uniref:Translocon-associated protein subunit delta n=1 Tax=Tigriopus californicus TaxID=6832 RepID=A0A553NZV4_TIGCA|nr:translocon-associated protein subunit delta-like [Tigriopus californicus]TRY70963.1 hypothetical protein TCAL_11625 [Tigriopus californicus]